MCRQYNVIQRRVERIGTYQYGNGVLCLGDVEEGHVGSAGVPMHQVPLYIMKVQL